MAGAPSGTVVEEPERAGEAPCAVSRPDEPVTVAEHTLYVVATPIGHRDDLSRRGRSVLAEVALIYAEDTRHTGALLRHHGIATPVRSLHEHNERDRAAEVVAGLEAGPAIALVSDAGTPLISDPGFRVVDACVAAGFSVSPVPGPSAVIAALSASGLPTDRFEFAGFPPARSGARQAWLAPLLERPHTVVLYESPHRVEATLRDAATLAGGARRAVLARELTKRFEEIVRAPLETLVERVAIDENLRRGEIVLLFEGRPSTDAVERHVIDVDTCLARLLADLPVSVAARITADLLGQSKRDVYRRALALQDDGSRRERD